MSTITKSGTVLFQLRLPETLYDKYAEQGIANGRSPEAEIAERLKRCQLHTSMTPLYFDDDQRRQLEKATGHATMNPAVVLEQLKHAVTLKVGNVEIELPERLQQRMRSRVFRGESYEQVLKREIVRGLEVFCGIRPS